MQKLFFSLLIYAKRSSLRRSTRVSQALERHMHSSVQQNRRIGKFIRTRGSNLRKHEQEQKNRPKLLLGYFLRGQEFEEVHYFFTNGCKNRRNKAGAAKIDAIKQELQNSFPDYEVSSGNINFAKNKDCFVHVKQVFASTED